MNWKRYQNELILLLSVLIAIAAFSYKRTMHRSMALENQHMAQEVAVLQEVAGLKKIWGDKRISKRLDSIRSSVASSKVTWQKKGKKLTARFTGLQPTEVNNIVSRLLNVPIQIEQLKVEKTGEVYKVEIKCKW